MPSAGAGTSGDVCLSGFAEDGARAGSRGRFVRSALERCGRCKPIDYENIL